MRKMLEWQTDDDSFAWEQDGEPSIFWVQRGKKGTLGGDYWTLKMGDCVTLSGHATLAEAQSQAQKLQDVLDGRDPISEVLEQVVGASKQRAKMSGQDSVRIDEVIAIVRSFMPPASERGDDDDQA